MTTEMLQKVSFNIILHAGNARSSAMEAISSAKTYQFEEAQEKIDEANEQLVQAHKVQTNLLTDEVNGFKNEVSILLIHAQDHLMTAITVKDLANEMIEMYEKIKQVEER